MFFMCHCEDMYVCGVCVDVMLDVCIFVVFIVMHCMSCEYIYMYVILIIYIIFIIFVFIFTVLYSA